MQSFEQLFDPIIGHRDQFSMQQRIFSASIAFAMLIIVAALLLVTIQQQIIVSFGLLACLVLYSCIYWLCRFGNQFQLSVKVFSFSFLLLLNIAWLIDNGVYGSTPYFAMLILVMICFSAEKPMTYITILLLNIAVLGIVDDHLRQLFPVQLAPSKIGAMGSLLACLTYLVILSSLYRRQLYQRLDNTLEDVMSQLEFESKGVHKKADAFSLSSEQLLASALQQTSAMDQLSVTTEELSATAKKNNELTNTSLTAMKEAVLQLQQNRVGIEQLTSYIEQIKAANEKIQLINNAINDISYQTNILSLNAMIEASRADDSTAGGFKVVALEVKNLAEGAAKAASSISSLLEENKKSVDDGVSLAHSVQQGFEDIESHITPLADTMVNVATASSEQEIAISQITAGLIDINQAINSNTELSRVSANNATDLRVNAESLSDVVGDLKLITDTE